MNLKLNLMVTDILNVNLTLINIMEKYLLIALLILLVSLTISFIIVIADYSVFKKRIERVLDINTEITNNTQEVISVFKKRIERVLDINTEITNNTKEVINITKKVNDSVGDICKLNNRLIVNLRNLLQENNALRNKIEDKEEINE